jgi:uncharacterized protein involved in exopolysaccharide biosynthesis
MEHDVEQRRGPAERDFTFLDAVLVIMKRKKFILAVTFGIVFWTAVISLVLPKTYMAETKILTPTQTQSSAQILSQLSGATTLNLGAAMGIRNPGEFWVGLLKSRPVLDAVIERFNLMALYRARYREDARKTLMRGVGFFDDRKAGIITIAVADLDPMRAAELANAFVEELKRVSKGLAISEAAQRRLFYEDQLKDVKESLLKAEESMKGFQQKTGVIRIDEQASAAIQTIARLKAQISAKEVQLRVMRTFATRQNPEMQMIQEEIAGLREQQSRLETRTGAKPDPMVPTSSIPEVGTDYLRRLRDVKFNETLHDMLLKQLEAAKLDESRDATVVQVIERAVPPEKGFGPKRVRMVLIAFLAALFVSVVGAFVMEYVERSRRDPWRNQRLEQIGQLATTGWRKRI